MHRINRALLALQLLLPLPFPLGAQQARIPSPRDVLGYALGENFTDAASVARYFSAVASATPRLRVRQYGETVEHRPLQQIVIAREDIIGRLDSVLVHNRELADPQTTEARAREIAARNPAVVYFSYGVHGNESSSTEAALWTAYDVLSGAANLGSVLDSIVIVIDPNTNPDGRERYISWYRQARGAAPNPNPESREHWEPWPGGRGNHYLFDLNRDWAWATQQETRSRLLTWDYWTPQVHVDFHEMEYNSSYFFFPATAPINPLYPEHILAWGTYFGNANAEAFDREGWAYFTGESYDLFYPGYGDSWPTLQGAIGMTYEQAGGSRAGLVVRTPSGQMLTLYDRAQHHRVSGEATLRAAAARKTALVVDFARFHRTSGAGMPDILIAPNGDDDKIVALAQHLLAEGISVDRATAGFRTEATPHWGYAVRRDFPAGTLRIRARQPRGRLAVTLLQPETLLKANFSYDITAWSLPYAYGLEAHRASVTGGAWVGWTSSTHAPAVVTDGVGQEPYGYLVRPGLRSWRGLVQLLRNGGTASVLQKPFVIEGTSWPAGTILIPRSGRSNLIAAVHAAGLDTLAVAVRSGRATQGHDLGTQESYTIRVPRVALLSGSPTSSSSYGACWFFLEQTLGLTFDAVMADRLPDLRWEDYDVLLVPDLSSSSESFNEKSLDAIKRWVQRGGTVIAVGDGARAVAAPLADIKPREPAKKDEKDLDRALRGREARERDRWENEIPGTILTARIDPAHPIAFGSGIGADSTRVFVLHRNDLVFEPTDTYESVAYFGEKLEKVSGLISTANLNRLSRGTWLASKNVGTGHVILFADDPLFRNFWYTGFQLLANALLLGPKS